MAYTPYTPDSTTASLTSSDIDLPDDAELTAAGIAATNAPLEDLADRVAKAGLLPGIRRANYATEVGVLLHATYDSATSTDWVDTGIDVTLSTASNVDRVWCDCAFSVLSSVAAVGDHRVRLVRKQPSGATAEITGTETVVAIAGAELSNVCLIGAYQPLATETTTVELQVMALSGTISIYNGTVIRAMAIGSATP